jgi:hypothetical protein
MPKTIYRLDPEFGQAQALLFEDVTITRLLRHFRLGAEVGEALAGWSTHDYSLPHGDFPSGMPYAPVLSSRVCEQFGDELRRSGALLPVTFLNEGPTDYCLYVVDAVVDCLDASRSSKPRYATGEMVKVVFRADAIDASLPAFRIPQVPAFVFWSDDFVTRLRAFGARALKVMVVWSDDPAVRAFPRAMR